MVQLVANDYVTFALYSDGSLYCWGDNSLSAGCAPAINAAFHAELLPYGCLLDVAADAAGVGRVGDRRYVVWDQGDARYPESGSFLNGGDIVQIAPTESGLLLLDDRGDVWHQGVLCFAFSGDGDCVTHRTWTHLNYSGRAVKVVGDYAVACAVLETGKVECLGAVSDDQAALRFALPAGKSLREAAELPIDGHVVDFQIAPYHTLARLDSGSIVASGSNVGERLGVSDELVYQRAAFESVPGIGLASLLRITSEGGCIQEESGDIWCWGVESAYWNDTQAPARLPSPPVVPNFLSAGDDLCVSDGSDEIYCRGTGTTCSTKLGEWDLVTFKTCPFTN